MYVPSCTTAGNRSTEVSLRCTNITCCFGMPQNRVLASTCQTPARQTGDNDAVLHELAQRLVATALDLELAQGLSDRGANDPVRRGKICSLRRARCRHESVQVGQRSTGVHGGVFDYLRLQLVSIAA